MKLRQQIAITTVLAGVVAGGWVWLTGTEDGAESRSNEGNRGAATRVFVEPIALVPDRVIIRAVGTGEALKSAAVHPSVAGEVVAVQFKAEQRVAKNAVLVRLDDAHQKLAIRLTEVGLRKARRDVARLKRLTASGHASRTRLDDAQTELESATVRLAQAKEDLADRSVLAPFVGVIGLTDISVGDRVDEDTMIATLDDRSTILVKFSLPEDYAAKVRAGEGIIVRPSNDPGRGINGTIFDMGSRIQTASRSLTVRAKIDNANDRIRPGASFEVELSFVGRPYPTVREVAVMWSRDGAYLWRANQKKAEKVFVKLVRRNRGRILVDGPLSAGDLVVVEGVQGLRSGQKLDPAPVGSDNSAAWPPRSGKNS